MKTPDVRWQQHFHSFQKAFVQLRSAVELKEQRALSDLERQGLIQAFEFTHELAWKTLKDFLEARGTINLFGSKDATREAFATGLIANGEAWMAMIQSRNRTTHTYNQQTANEIAEAVANTYFTEFRNFEQRFLAFERTSP